MRRQFLSFQISLVSFFFFFLSSFLLFFLSFLFLSASPNTLTLPYRRWKPLVFMTDDFICLLVLGHSQSIRPDNPVFMLSPIDEVTTLRGVLTDQAQISLQPLASNPTGIYALSNPALWPSAWSEIPKLLIRKHRPLNNTCHIENQFFISSTASASRISHINYTMTLRMGLNYQEFPSV